MDDGSSEKLWQWSIRHERCACCWIHHRQAERLRWPGLQTHHIIKRSKRVCHEGFNLLRLCERCHRLAELERVRGGDGELLPKLWLPVCVGLKREANPDEWNEAKLTELNGGYLPEPEPVPGAFLEERDRWQPIPHWSRL